MRGVHHPEFEAMHKEMQAWYDRQERAGWRSAELRQAAYNLTKTLERYARTRTVYPAELNVLVGFTEAFRQAHDANAY